MIGRMPSRPPAAVRPDQLPGVDSPRAWLIVVATFISTFTGFGLVYSFGAFFDSMAAEFNAGRAATAFMLAITSAIYFSLGVLTGRIGDRVGPKPLLLIAAVSLGTGVILTSRVQSIELGYLTYGLGLGIAVSCAYVPMVAFTGGWFSRRRTTALGVAVSGIGMGTLIMAPVSQALIDAYGWRQAFVILGIGGAVTMLLAAVIAQRPPVHQQSDPAPSLRFLLRNRQFVLLYLNGVLIGTTILVSFAFLKNYALGFEIASGSAALLVGLVGASSVVGRLGIGSLGGRFDPVSLLRGSFVLMTLSYFLWLFSGGRFAVLVLFALVMGVGYGGYIALMPAVAATIFGTKGLGQTLGLLYTSAGIGGLIGPTLIGAVIDAASYEVALVVTIVVTACSAACLFFIGRNPVTLEDFGGARSNPQRQE